MMAQVAADTLGLAPERVRVELGDSDFPEAPVSGDGTPQGPNGTSIKKGELAFALHSVAEWTGLEPATPGVTGRYSNQLNYHSRIDPRTAHGGC